MAHYHYRSSYDPHNPSAMYAASVETSPSMYSQASLPRSDYRDSSIYHYPPTTDRGTSDRYRSNKKSRSSTPSSVASTRASVDSAAAYYAAAAQFQRPTSSHPAKSGHGLSRISEDDDRQSRGYHRESLDSSRAIVPRAKSASGHRRHHSSPSAPRYNNTHANTPSSTHSNESMFPPVQSPAMYFPKPPSHHPSRQPPASKRDRGNARKEQLTQIIIGTDAHGFAVANFVSKSKKATTPEYELGGRYGQPQPGTNSDLPSPSSYSTSSFPRSEAHSADTHLTVPSLTSATNVTAHSLGPQTPRSVRYHKYDITYEADAASAYSEADEDSFHSPSSLKMRIPGLISRLFGRRRSSSMVSKAVVDVPFTYPRKSPATSVKSLPAIPSSSVKSILKKKHRPSASLASNIGETQSLHSARTGAGASFRRRKLLFNPFSIFTARKRTSSVSGARSGTGSAAGTDLHAFIQENHPKIGKKGARMSARRSTGVTGWISDEFQIDPRDATMTLRSLQLAEGKAAAPYPA